LRVIAKLERPDIAIDVVVGGSNPHRITIEALCKNMPNVSLHIQTSAMAGLMAKADIALGGGGSTSWERCALGLPAIIISLAENQTAIAKALASQGSAIFLGEVHQVRANKIWAELERLISSPRELQRMSEKCTSLVDGEGTARVVNAMIGLA
jgi:UDP-2,4-diacetamido-2,4,6-trideoxy-beta-L-altropyranose hydrolase